MSLAGILGAVRALHDLPHLVAALGYEPYWEDVPPEAWLAGTHRAATITGAAVVGRAGRFLWFGVETDEPGRTARAIAAVLLQRGETAGVIALNSAHRRLALAVAFGDPAAIEIDLASPSRLALTCLARVRGAGDGEALAIAARAAEALSGEAVGRRFFESFRDTVDRMSASLESPASVEDRRNLVLLQLTRVLFLYFVQAKGWLDGDQEFLRHRVDDCLTQRRQIHRDLLRPLFFGTLNRPAAHRGRSAGFGQVPYLNGGLFEPHPLERRWRGDIPNRLWGPAFDDLFERFHFTVSESGTEGSVAPDMLGQVFEGVMAPDLRRASGTFYTPAALVQDLLEAGLAALVGSRLKCSDEKASARIRSGEPRAQEILKTLTLLDPAAGSGAFLVGALEHLTRLRSGHDQPAGGLKREILRSSLFGVDLNPMAVRLTELRLWLAVIADDPERRAERVVPLPNLDCLVRQGDSLFDPVGFTSQFPLRATGAARLLTGIRRRFVVAVGAEKREMARALRQTETQAMGEWLDQAEERLGLETAECLSEARAPTLFGDRRGMDASLREQLNRLRQRVRTIRRARRRLDQAGELPWFQYQSHFADVFAARGGFDLVVGNPPWVRAEQLERGLRERLEQRYRWWRGGGGPGFSHRPDLAVAFLERAHELTAPDGVLALLLPAKLATAGYGAAARRALSADATLHAVADLTGSAGAQFGATVYPLALVASKTPATPGQLVRDTLAPEAVPAVPQVMLRGGAPWAMVRSDLRAALEAVHAAHPRLGDRFAVQLGVKTGANPVFLNPSTPIEASLLRWVIRGRDVRPFRADRRVRIIWTHDAEGRVFPRLPPLATAWFERHRALLLARADHAGGPPWTLFRVAPAAARHRVVWADLGRRLNAVALDDVTDRDRIPLNTCYVVAAPDARTARCLAAWLNSSWIRAAARVVACPARGGFARFNGRTVASLPLPDAALTDSALSDFTQSGSNDTVVQEALDDICARHLDLSGTARRTLAAVAGVDRYPGR